MTAIRQYDTGATRDTETGKLDYAGFLSPLALRRFAEYMHQHRQQADGQLRDGGNWKKGIPKDDYFRSGIRHTMDLWCAYESGNEVVLEELLCACLFNWNGLLHELIKDTE